MFPKFLRFENSGGGNDSGDKFRRRHIKARIACATGGIGDADVFALTGLGYAPGTEDFTFISVFNRNIETVF